MSIFKKWKTIVLTIAALGAIMSCGSRYTYESVEGDPLQARIYTLDNGLKVYMTVNKETPRIQTYIAVKVGAKDDPAETTDYITLNILCLKVQAHLEHRITNWKNRCLIK